MTDEPEDAEVIEEQAPEEPPKPAYDPEIAEEARFFGWKAPEEWVGDKPAGYIDDPVRFLDRIKDSRIFKASEQRFEAKLNDVASRLARVTDNVIARQKSDYENRLKAIQQAQRQAVETADVQRFEQLEREKQSLAPPVIDAPAPPTVDPVVTEYIHKNDWAKDPALRFEGAQAIEVALRQGRQFKDYADQLQYAEGVMRRKYPHLFQAQTPPAASRATRVDGGGLASGVGGSTGFEKLPAEAKAAFKRFVAQGVFEDSPAGRKQYVEDYNA